MKLTQRKIENLECPPGRRDMMIFDDEQAGLGVRVAASGGKSFLAQYTLAGAKRRVPLGSCNAIPLAKAREAARAILGDVAKGRDPAGDRVQKAMEAKRKAARDILTLRRLDRPVGLAAPRRQARVVRSPKPSARCALPS